MRGFCADHSHSAVRKVDRIGRPRAMLLMARTTVRAMLLAQAADFLVSSCLDAWRCPFLHPTEDVLPWNASWHIMLVLTG